jgi:DNA adenine methylase
MTFEQLPARPLLKWVGGKSKLISEIRAAFPKQFNSFHEPFLGGAAMFFALQHRPSFLYDINPKLTKFYETVAASPSELFGEIKSLENEFNALDQSSRKTWYYKTRERFNLEPLSDLQQSALFLALNKTCFNGIYRENAAGQFNVPFNHATKVLAFADEENFYRASDALKSAEISGDGYKEVEARAVRGDLVYFDPPYVPLSPTSSFTSYHASGFGEVQQYELIELCVRLRTKGVHVIASNSYSPWILENYSSAGFTITPVTVMRGIAAKTSSRNQISEALIV